MARRVLVPLDGSDYSKVATRLAIDIVEDNGGTVVGLGVVDEEEIEESVIGAGIGASYYAEHLSDYKKNKALGKIKNFIEDFEEMCKDAKVKFESYTKSGDPVEEIIQLGKTSDLIITGTRTFFHFETTPEPGDTLQELLEASVCPILAVPQKLNNWKGDVLIAYDESIFAAKAMKMYVRYAKSYKKLKKIYVLNVNDDIDESNRILNSVQKYFDSHGLKIEKVSRVGKPRDEIIKFAKENNIRTIVMGAYGVKGISRLFFGHASRNVLEDGSIPMFVYH